MFIELTTHRWQAAFLSAVTTYLWQKPVRALPSVRESSAPQTRPERVFVVTRRKGADEMSITKKVRFEVFKRDKFTCQYCGRSAPDVILQVDHIEPRSKGGSDDLLNLVTSCRGCNAGKSNRRLSDDAVVKQRKRQLDELQERRDQLEMLMEWQRSLVGLEELAVTELADLWDSLVPGYHANDNGLRTLRQWVNKFPVAELAESMRIATRQYLKYEGESEHPTHDSVENAWKYIPRICRVREQQEEKPYLQDLFYIRGILRNRLMYVDEHGVIGLMENAHKAGMSISELQKWARNCRNWSMFRDVLQDTIDGRRHG